MEGSKRKGNHYHSTVHGQRTPIRSTEKISKYLPTGGAVGLRYNRQNFNYRR